MLSPRYLAGCSDDIVKLYAQLESDILADIARRITKMGGITDASEYQMQLFREVGGLQADIQKMTSRYNETARAELETLFNDAMAKSAKNDTTVYSKAGLSANQQQILDATVKKTASAGIIGGSEKVKQEATAGFIKVFSGVQRATMTIASSMCNEFVQQANAAYMKVSTGATDYNTALKQGADALAEKGVYTVEYTDSGKRITRTMEGALRANILTGINQTANQITQDNCAALDCDLVEVSAHIGARPSHAAWQGKIYSLSGQSTKYPSFKECCKPGEPDGIGGINCRHSYYPYFEGTDPLYSDGELDELKEPRVTYNGKELTQYEAEQKLRAVERQIRKYKRKAACCAEMHLDATNEKQKIGEWQALARDFCIQTGIRRDSAREYIGTKDGKQPRAVTAAKTKTTAKITGGSSGGILDKSEDEKTRFAKEYYASIRNRKSKSDIQHIAKNTNFSESDIAAIRSHLFEGKKHLFADGSIKEFDADAKQAIAWQRLEKGKYTETDILLLKHELFELTLMRERGYNYDVAHAKANELYDWQEAVK